MPLVCGGRGAGSIQRARPRIAPRRWPRPCGCGRPAPWPPPPAPDESAPTKGRGPAQLGPEWLVANAAAIVLPKPSTIGKKSAGWWSGPHLAHHQVGSHREEPQQRDQVYKLHWGLQALGQRGHQLRRRRATAQRRQLLCRHRNCGGRPHRCAPATAAATAAAAAAAAIAAAAATKATCFEGRWAIDEVGARGRLPTQPRPSLTPKSTHHGLIAFPSIANLLRSRR